MNLARKTDPLESHQAANEILADGPVKRMCDETLRWLNLFPGLTANELELRAGMKDGQFRKRLNDLLKKRLVYKGVSRISLVTQKKNAIWFPTGVSEAVNPKMVLRGLL